MEKLKILAEYNDLTVDVKDRNLAEAVQDSYKLLYRAKESGKEEFLALVQEHLAVMKSDISLESICMNLSILESLESLGDEAELNEVVIKKRKPRRSRDPKRSKAAKRAWRKNKRKMTKALNKYRKSAKGKAFYRALGKFNSKMMDSVDLTLQDQLELLKATSSALTHLVVEAEKEPDFMETFREAATMVSYDLMDLLESIVEGEDPDKELLESIQEFHSILAEKDEEVI